MDFRSSFASELNSLRVRSLSRGKPMSKSNGTINILVFRKYYFRSQSNRKTHATSGIVNKMIVIIIMRVQFFSFFFCGNKHKMSAFIISLPLRAQRMVLFRLTRLRHLQ